LNYSPNARFFIGFTVESGRPCGQNFTLDRQATDAVRTKEKKAAAVCAAASSDFQRPSIRQAATRGSATGQTYGRFKGVIDSLPRLPFNGFTLFSFDPFLIGVFVIFGLSLALDLPSWAIHS